ncbi:MAG: hypothetical protein OHK0028_21660 [Deltaproteobacteria bacterium]
MKSTRLALVLFLSAFVHPGIALSWGEAPTHPVIAAKIVSDDLSSPALPPEATDLQRFVRASACPDLAETLLFRSSGFGYVHTVAFADVLREVALSDPSRWGGGGVATAYAWGVHLAADAVGHEEFLPPSQPLHTMAEVAVDTVLYFDPANYQPGNPGNLLALLGFPRWEDTVPRPDDCAPALVSAASSQYRRKVDPSVKAIAAWQVWWATQTLGTAIRAEYDYIRAKGNDDASEIFLKGIGLWPFTDPIGKSVTAAQEWIR